MFNKMAEVCVAILDVLTGYFFCVFTVIFMKRTQIFLRYEERFRDIKKKNPEFPQTYLGNFS